MSKPFYTDWEKGKTRVMARVAGQTVQRMDRATTYVAEIAQANAPVWRGVLKSNVMHSVTAKGNTIIGIVGVKKEAYWAWFQEMGTMHHAAQPFLRPAVFDNLVNIERILNGER